MAEVLAAVHGAGQVAGDGKLRETVALVEQQGRDVLHYRQHVPASPVGQADVQVGQTALGLPPDAALGVGGVGFQLLIPILALFAVHQHGTQHTHTRHKHRAVRDLPLVQIEIVAAQLVVVAVARVHPGVAD